MDTNEEVMRTLGRIEGVVEHFDRKLDGLTGQYERLEARLEKHERSVFRLATVGSLVVSSFSAVIGALASLKMGKLLQWWTG